MDTKKELNSKEKLAQALEKYLHDHTTVSDDLNAKQVEGIKKLIVEARNGDYSDYDSKYATPQIYFLQIWDALGLPQRTDDSIAYKMTQGEFDATKEESEEWFKREGKQLALEVCGGNQEIADAIFGKIDEEEKESKEGIKGWDI